VSYLSKKVQNLSLSSLNQILVYILPISVSWCWVSMKWRWQSCVINNCCYHQQTDMNQLKTNTEPRTITVDLKLYKTNFSSMFSFLLRYRDVLLIVLWAHKNTAEQTTCSEWQKAFVTLPRHFLLTIRLHTVWWKRFSMTFYDLYVPCTLSTSLLLRDTLCCVVNTITTHTHTSLRTAVDLTHLILWGWDPRRLH